MTNTNRPALLVAASLLGLAACAHHGDHGGDSDSNIPKGGPVVLQTKPTSTPAWISVALTLAGSEVDHNKRDDCLEEAGKAGIELAAAATISGTLHFLSNDDFMESSVLNGGKYSFSPMSGNAECRVALAKLTNLDTVVTASKNEPTGCKNLGSVEGTDSGFMVPGSYDAAVAEAQFRVRSLGGNYLVMDAVVPEGAQVAVHGRAYACSK